MRAAWEWWKRSARKIGEIQSRMLLTAFYFVVTAPFALMVRWGADPLGIKSSGAPAWRVRELPGGSPTEVASRQF